MAPPSQRIIEQMQDVFARWNAGDRTVDLDTVDPDVELHSPLTSTRGGPYRGHDGLGQWLDDIDQQFSEWELRVSQWKPLDDGRLLGLGEIHARGRESGIELDQELAWLFTFRDDKLLRYDAFYDQGEGLRAVGIER